VQALPVSHVTVAELIAKRRFGFVAFTGSVRGGHEVYRTVAHENFVGVGLELGGKDPALVLPDCDFDHAVDNLVDGAFFNSGQSCCGIERVYVHADLYDRFVEAYVAKTRQYVVGSPLEAGTTIGPVVTPSAAERIRAQIAQALAGGARALVGASDFFVPDLGSCYVAPHVLVDVTHDMDVMAEETFGPVVGIMKYKSVEEGVRLANDSRYGLTASVWTQDADRGLAIMQQLQAGTVYMNRCDYLDPGLAWTGVKDSGHGASLSQLGFHAVTRPKSYHLRTRT
jgi:acyl-CoA reductase-like NAD-dependent aldehyde dehydrogenase